MAREFRGDVDIAVTEFLPSWERGEYDILEPIAAPALKCGYRNTDIPGLTCERAECRPNSVTVPHEGRDGDGKTQRWYSEARHEAAPPAPATTSRADLVAAIDEAEAAYALANRPLTMSPAPTLESVAADLVAARARVAPLVAKERESENVGDLRSMVLRSAGPGEETSRKDSGAENINAPPQPAAPRAPFGPDNCRFDTAHVHQLDNGVSVFCEGKNDKGAAPTPNVGDGSSLPLNIRNLGRALAEIEGFHVGGQVFEFLATQAERLLARISEAYDVMAEARRLQTGVREHLEAKSALLEAARETLDSERARCRGLVDLILAGELKISHAQEMISSGAPVPQFAPAPARTPSS